MPQNAFKQSTEVETQSKDATYPYRLLGDGQGGDGRGGGSAWTCGLHLNDIGALLCLLTSTRAHYHATATRTEQRMERGAERTAATSQQGNTKTYPGAL